MGTLSEATLQSSGHSTSVTSPPVSANDVPEISQSITPASSAPTGGFLPGHSRRSLGGTEFREARSRSYAMAPPTALQRKGSDPESGGSANTQQKLTSPEDGKGTALPGVREAQDESVPLNDGERAALPDVVEPEDNATKTRERSEESDAPCSDDDEIVEYTVESPSGSQECMISDDEEHAAALAGQEEGTVNPVSHSVLEASSEVDVERTIALSSEDTYYEGQAHPRRKTASDDTAALVQRLSLSYTPREPADSLVKTGFLKKKSPNPLVGWQRRWFVLDDKRLIYYRAADDVVPAGRIDLSLVKIKIQCMWDPHDFKGGLVSTMGSTVHLPRAQGSKWMELLCCGGGKTRFYAEGRDLTEEVRCRVKPVGSARAFELAGPYVELVDWIDKLSLAAKSCRISSRHIMRVSQQKGFWKVERISPAKFSDIVDTGDVLLFRTKVLNAALQRAITRGTYDHVALLLRSFEGHILILESMGDTGVIVTPWNLFTTSEWFSAYRKIVLRRLRWMRTAEKLERLLEFVKRVIGKNYELTFSKLISRKKSEEDGGYFCSELVASALQIYLEAEAVAMRVPQEIGALPANAVPSRFWPESFAARSNLKLCKGYELEEELLVDFTLVKRSHEKSRAKKEHSPQLQGRVVRSTVPTSMVKHEGSAEKPPALVDVVPDAAQLNLEAAVGRGSLVLRRQSSVATNKSG